MLDKRYSVIVFDLGMVLLPYNYNIALERLEKINSGFGVNYLNHYKTNKETFKKIYSEIFTVNEDVAALLPELKKNYTLLLLSNTNSIHREYGWKNYKFLQYFDKLILSYEVNAVKPEEKIYRAVEKSSERPPHSHIFIDDVKEYAEAAIKCGWGGIQFTGYEKLVNELKNRKIL